MNTTPEETISKLSDESLLAILLTSEKGKYYSMERAGHLLKSYQGGLNELLSCGIEALSNQNGIGWTNAMKLKAALELSKRKQLAESLERPKISKSSDVCRLFCHLSDLLYEEFWILVLNRSNWILGKVKVSEGGINATHVDPKRIFIESLRLKGSAIVLVHNHPSGNTKPSDADLRLTKRISEAGKLLEIAVLDHIIICQREYYSLADNGLI